MISHRECPATAVYATYIQLLEMVLKINERCRVKINWGAIMCPRLLPSFLCFGVAIASSLAGSMNLQALCSYVLNQVQVHWLYTPLQLLQNVKNEIIHQKISKYTYFLVISGSLTVSIVATILSTSSAEKWHCKKFLKLVMKALPGAGGSAASSSVLCSAEGCPSGRRDGVGFTARKSRESSSIP